ncbi:hypothetical protein DL768_009600 [Monosporascus sp. mg162]|nr:hypothetical protein DL768_009600 [Monosporascus sp. mg162]
MAGSVSAWKGFSEEHGVGDAVMKHNEAIIKEAFGDLSLGDEDDDDDNFVPALDHPLRFYDADGVLHYAFYLWERHGQADLLLPRDEDDRQYDENGQVKRPTYKTAQYQPRDEINWRRWPRKTADLEEEYDPKDVMGTWDFNPPDEDKKGRIDPLDNFEKTAVEDLFPRGIELLKKESARRGAQEWSVGQPLGPDPNSKTALRKHLGWVPKTMRRRGVGLGGDKTDPVAAEWSKGNLRAMPPDNFRHPPAPWSKNPARVVVMHKEGNLRRQFRILSKPALMAWIKSQPPLPPPVDDIFEDAVQDLNLFGTARYHSTAKQKAGQREAAREALNLVAEGVPQTEIHLNARARRLLARQQRREAEAAAAAGPAETPAD